MSPYWLNILGAVLALCILMACGGGISGSGNIIPLTSLHPSPPHFYSCPLSLGVGTRECGPLEVFETTAICVYNCIPAVTSITMAVSLNHLQNQDWIAPGQLGTAVVPGWYSLNTYSPFPSLSISTPPPPPSLPPFSSLEGILEISQIFYEVLLYITNIPQQPLLCFYYFQSPISSCIVNVFLAQDENVLQTARFYSL